MTYIRFRQAALCKDTYNNEGRQKYILADRGYGKHWSRPFLTTERKEQKRLS